MRPVGLELEQEQFVSDYHVSNSSPHHTTRVCVYVCVCVHFMHVGMFLPLPAIEVFIGKYIAMEWVWVIVRFPENERV